MSSTQANSPAPQTRRYTICVDFDGVLHSYTSPFSPTSIPDPPVPGALEWLEQMCEQFNVVIFSTRATRYGATLIYDWLETWGFPAGAYLAAETMTITNEKTAALIYIDDRAYRFTGDNFPTTQEIHRARPWNKPPATPQPIQGDEHDA